MVNDASAKITVDGKDHDVQNLSPQAKAQLQNLRFCDLRLQQLQSEWAVADTARLAYSSALKREVLASPV